VLNYCEGEYDDIVCGSVTDSCCSYRGSAVLLVSAGSAQHSQRRPAPRARMECFRLWIRQRRKWGQLRRDA